MSGFVPAVVARKGCLLLPPVKRGATRYVKAVLHEGFWVEEHFGERKYKITLSQQPDRDATSSTAGSQVGAAR